MLKRYFSYSPLPLRYFFYSGLVLSFILILRSYLISDISENGFYGNINHSVLTFWKYTFWPLFIPSINYFLKKGLGQNKLSSKLGIFFSATIGIALVHAIITNVAYYLTLWPLFGSETVLRLLPELLEVFWWIMANRLLDLVLLIGLILGIDFYNTYTESKLEVSVLRSELKEAELVALRNQLKPHFLFNTLNTISSLIDQDTQKAQKVLSKIAHLLRTNLDHSRKEKITLQEELEVVKDYLEIESERFNDRLLVSYDISLESQKAKIPNMLIQPFVENVIKHAVHKTSSLIELKLITTIEENQLVVKVSDNGPKFISNQNTNNNEGVGLSNIKNRLALLYGKEAELEINCKEGLTFEVMIKLPLEYEA